MLSVAGLYAQHLPLTNNATAVFEHLSPDLSIYHVHLPRYD